MRKIPSLHEAHYLTYALDSPSSGGKLVNIDEVENGSACQCFCPACHEPLIAKNNGEIREHHFAHKSGTECEHAYESMLHLYAKEAIQQEFLSAKKFHITLEQKTYCSKKGDHVCSPKEEFCPKATKQHFINNSDRTKVCKLNNLVVSDTSTAKTCQYFHIDEERMNKELSDGPKARYEIVYER